MSDLVGSFLLCFTCRFNLSGRPPLQSKILPFSLILILIPNTWQMKNLIVKNKATSKRNLLLCSNTFQLPPLQTLSPYITALGSIWQEAIGNSVGNLGVTGVIPKSSWCYISSASKKNKKSQKNHVETSDSFLGYLHFCTNPQKLHMGLANSHSILENPISPSGFCSNPLPNIKNLNEFHQNSLLWFWISQI